MLRRSLAIADVSLCLILTLLPVSFARAQGTAGGAPTSLAPASRSSNTVVVRVDSPIYLLPDASREPLRMAKAGSILRLVGVSGDWMNVEFQDPSLGRRAGFILTRNVAVSEPVGAAGVDVSIPGLQPATSTPSRNVRPEPQTTTERSRAPLPSQGGEPNTKDGHRTPNRAWVNVDVARYVSRQKTLTVASATPLYRETLAAAAVYPELSKVNDIHLSAGFAAAGNLSLGVNFDGQNYASFVGLGISVPSPYFFSRSASDGRPTAITVARKDRAIDLSGVYRIPMSSPDISLRIFGGPTYFRITNEMIEKITYVQSASSVLPINSVTIRSFTSNDVTGSSIGFNIGADVGYFFSRHVGLGAAVKQSRGNVTVTDPLSGDKTTLAAGHLQFGGGLRLRF